MGSGGARMKAAVVGLWHLGTVTAACLATAGFDVVAYDSNPEVVDNLKNNKAPIFEPGLDKLITQENLQYASNLKDINSAEIVWVTYDTPVDEDDNADVEFVINEIKNLFPFLQDHT